MAVNLAKKWQKAIDQAFALESLTKVAFAGKFEHKAYMISGGLHGVGVSVVNALSKKLIVEVKRDGKVWRQEYVRGKPRSDVKAVGKTDKTGTTVVFYPDNEIFSVLEFDFSILQGRLREIAFLNPGTLFFILNFIQTFLKIRSGM